MANSNIEFISFDIGEHICRIRKHAEIGHKDIKECDRSPEFKPNIWYGVDILINQSGI